MSGAGSPNLSPAETVDGSGLKITIVAGRWHDTIASGLLAGAHRVLDSSGAEITELRVPGSFELPVACKAALEA
ncbi:MAG TPA: 6,7-dimethyl-8-ribityllumazine synthase, partial [Terrimesophilobacter sp.]|nr:6,7-dimethyl-8-ribityllumazine synthase [Terrimesophilobacter sp.]